MAVTLAHAGNRKAERKLINNLPESVIEEAREVWLNTNTRIILEARQALAATLEGAK